MDATTLISAKLEKLRKHWVLSWRRGKIQKDTRKIIELKNDIRGKNQNRRHHTRNDCSIK